MGAACASPLLVYCCHICCADIGGGAVCTDCGNMSWPVRVSWGPPCGGGAAAAAACDLQQPCTNVKSSLRMMKHYKSDTCVTSAGVG